MTTDAADRLLIETLGWLEAKGFKDLPGECNGLIGRLRRYRDGLGADARPLYIIHTPTEVEMTEEPRTRHPNEPQQLDPEIETRFTYHSPKDGQPEKYVAIRERAKELAYLINAVCPDSREKSRAFTALDDVVFNANASIARRE